MDRNGRRLTLVLATMFASLLLVAPDAAFAVRPGSSPTYLIAEGFESNTVPQYSLENPLMGTAQWGPITQRFRIGARGLWCAGSGGWTTTYRTDTSGRVRFNLPQMSEYFSANLGFYYLKPSVGGGEANSGFNVQWESTPASVGTVTEWANTSTWKYGSVNLTSADSSKGSLSRTPGSAFFFFRDLYDPPGTPANGEGPTIDDVTVTAWKYGPVRNLEVQATSSAINLTWDRPYASTTKTVLEDRPIGYRVWRAPSGTAFWTEVTAAGPVQQTSVSDMLPSTGTSYVYVVQAWDAGNGYGIPTEQQVPLPGNPALRAVLADTVSPSVVGYGAAATATGLLTLDGKPLEGAPVSLQYYASGWKVAGTQLTDANGKVTFSAKPYNKNKTAFRLNFSVPGFVPVDTVVKSVTPRPFLGTPTRPTVAYKDRKFTTKAALNPRHTSGKTGYVKVLCYRYESGKWKYRKGVWATTYNYSTYSRVYAKVGLPYRGTWKMRAYAPADSRHAAHYSGYTQSFRVK